MIRALAFLLALTAAAPLAAQQGDTGGPRPPGVVLVYDSSGSMAAPTADASGRIRKYAVARRLVDTLAERLVEAAVPMEVGLVVFGAGFDRNGTSAALGCTDVQIALPRLKLTRSSANRMIRETGSARPRGFTPLGLALSRAIAMLGGAGGTVVIVTDVENTCEDGTPNEACEVLARANRGRPPSNRVTVDTIVVPRGAGMNMAPAQRLAGCMQALLEPVSTEAGATQAAAAIAARLAAHTPAAPPATAPADAIITGAQVVNRSGAALDGADIVLQDRGGRSVRLVSGAPAGETRLPAGTYRVTVSRDGRILARPPDIEVPEGRSALFVGLD
ncbi:MAG TPA: hypothetical protein VLA00_11115 [Xanthobacteraceae bacterium]|nr:hypothetical protein [Xanthobacteraceae bacterium]